MLFAQEELRVTLARPSLRNFKSRIVMASTLDPLSLEELHAMLKFRWEVATGGQPHPFTNEAVTALFEASHGMPREANIVADNSLLLAFHHQTMLIDAHLVQRVVADRTFNLGRKEARK